MVFSEKYTWAVNGNGDQTVCLSDTTKMGYGIICPIGDNSVYDCIEQLEDQDVAEAEKLLDEISKRHGKIKNSLRVPSHLLGKRD